MQNIGIHLLEEAVKDLMIVKVLHWKVWVVFLLQQWLDLVSAKFSMNISWFIFNVFNYSVLAMIILCVEIYNHRKKNGQEDDDSFKGRSIMPETLEVIGDSLDNGYMKNNVMLGASQIFVPKTDQKRRLSYISVLPRSPMN